MQNTLKHIAITLLILLAILSPMGSNTEVTEESITEVEQIVTIEEARAQFSKKNDKINPRKYFASDTEQFSSSRQVVFVFSRKFILHQSLIYYC